MTRKSRIGWFLIALCGVLFQSGAEAALLRFTVSTGEGPQAYPLIRVTVSGLPLSGAELTVEK
jgi:hypothetical protein